jgi:tRNA (guanine-N(7)-)-methyltransferase subunit TRM82
LFPAPTEEEKKTEQQQQEPVTDEKAPQKPKLRGTLTSHENPSNGTLILGHTSMLNAMLLSDDERYIFTADRDEHIRISHFPRGWDIERYCLGHKKYVYQPLIYLFFDLFL